MILDRLSFMRFLGLSLSHIIPDEKTIWAFRQKLVESKKIEVLFERFRDYLQEEHVLLNSGSIVDATLVDAPIQRNSKDENEQIKNGKTPEEWEKRPEKKRQKDTDARWVKKNGSKYYGYKNHIKADKKTKLIRSYTITDASVHDSQVLESLLDDSDERWPLYADSAYSGEPIKAELSNRRIQNHIHEKGYRGKPLTEKQRQSNKGKSKIRARVEHIFGFMKNSMDAGKIRSIGIERAKAILGLVNLTYNIQRHCFLAANG